MKERLKTEAPPAGIELIRDLPFNRWWAYICFLILSFSLIYIYGGKELNTRYQKGFVQSQFDAIKVGESRDSVKSRLGWPIGHATKNLEPLQDVFYYTEPRIDHHEYIIKSIEFEGNTVFMIVDSDKE